MALYVFVLPLKLVMGFFLACIFAVCFSIDGKVAGKTNDVGGSDETINSAQMATAMQELMRQQELLLASHEELLKKVDFIRQGPSQEADDSIGNMPIFSTIILVSGCAFLFKLFFTEYQIYQSKVDEEGINLGEFLQYRLDFYFSSSQMAKPLLLLTLSFIIILQASILLMLLVGDDLASAMWKAWTYVADPGTHADTEGTYGKIVAFCTTIGGMLVFALMIGVISDTIGEQVDDFKQGKSKVIETRHTLILGWSEKGLAILRQLALANQSEGGMPVVVLCEQSKQSMEDMLRAAVSSKDDGLKLYGSRVIFRSGNPLAEHDLIKVSASQCRAIIALSPDGLESDAADSRMVRQVLSLQKIKQTHGGLRGHIVVELQDVDNRALVQMVGKGDVEVIVSHDLIGRMMLLAARSPWLATVLDDLMGFEGSEFYLKEWPELVGKPFGSITFRFDNAVPVGVKQAKDGKILINPRRHFVLSPGDLVLALAEDDSSYVLNDRECVDYESTYPKGDSSCFKKEAVKPPERMLFCGWRRDMADMISELDYDVPPGSELWLFNNVPMEQRAIKLLDKGNKSQLKLRNIAMKHVVGNPVVRRELLSLVEVSDGTEQGGVKYEVGERTGRREVLDYFTSILILSDCSEAEGSDATNFEQSDSRSVATTLIIQDIQRSITERKHALGQPCELSPPISEILDSRTRSLMQLISSQGYQGYVMSNHLVASALAMVSEDRNMNVVYGELLSCQGNQIQIRRARDYVNVQKNEPLCFWDLSCLASMSDEILIGYIPYKVDENGKGTVEVQLNPVSKTEPRIWDAQDRLIVITMCRQARFKQELRNARSQAEADLYAQFSSRGDVLIHGWLRKLNSGKENEMDDEANWRDRLCFVMNRELSYASEKKKGETERVCGLDDIRGIQAGNGWPPGFNTFKLDIGGSKSVIFSATTPEDCRRWILVLSPPAGEEAAKS